MNGSATSPSGGLSTRARAMVFGAVAACCAVGAAGYAAYVAAKRQAADDAAPVLAIQTVPAAGSKVLATGNPAMVFRSTALGESYGRVVVADLADLKDPQGPRRVTPLQCDRVYFAAGQGICLVARRGVTTSYQAQLFNAAFEVTHSLPLAGPPSRARVSPDGRFASMTVFIAGHSYANTDFTTRTSVVDTRTGKLVIEDLEQLPVTRDGASFHAANFNFWGITFAHRADRADAANGADNGQGGQRFYATLGSADRRLLVEGDMATRRMKVIHDNVECPSVSPDNRHIAYKRRAPADASGRVVWRLFVLEIASGRETALATESRNVDDQVEWLNDEEIVYALPDDNGASTPATNTWALAISGEVDPRLLAARAFSPAVVRASAAPAASHGD